MKLITVEEHFESAAVTAAMRQAVGNAALPTVSPALRQYMRDNLPSPAIMQDTQHERLAFMAQYACRSSELRGTTNYDAYAHDGQWYFSGIRIISATDLPCRTP
ncbi:hypothetical protein IMAU10585_02154 [Lactiplantibacillus plantarum]|uniref:hypothetical protein n=1 Tax=Lactiplantibacillus plantarum TaxID=1590 RepID=UPI000350794A|nr:hypothetical protein [Lactiplantibacillus plantarum]AGO09340.1 metal-dependent hydrolase, N-terminal domain protein [Lactiplantibacillus plantarum 16]KZU39786.1 2-amino-3-carboxymuconate-6-semialdehydedecarboxylase [Lactiplantibacillus plantarum]MCC6116371.1 hypothetical protein [Lactiplantibacillus plantarum]MCG0621676.1 hypothetical protein [Lactiplantibacillus plantarum]MCG0757693.1 hypothetical protein [Lactiplantibacillus plantarum]